MLVLSPRGGGGGWWWNIRMRLQNMHTQSRVNVRVRDIKQHIILIGTRQFLQKYHEAQRPFHRYRYSERTRMIQLASESHASLLHPLTTVQCFESFVTQRAQRTNRTIIQATTPLSVSRCEVMSAFGDSFSEKKNELRDSGYRTQCNEQQTELTLLSTYSS